MVLLTSILLAVLLPQEQNEPYGYALKVAPNGHVEMTVFEKDASGKSRELTYTAESMAEFVRAYPELARRYRLSAPGSTPPPPSEPDAFESWKRRFEGRWFWDREGQEDFDDWLNALPKSPQSEELSRWMEEQLQLFEKFRRLPSPPLEATDPRPRLGVLVAPLGDTQAKKLGLENPRAVVIASVQKGSLAERSGIRRGDVVLEINGKPVPDLKSFQEEVLKSGDGCDLEVLRKGTREKIRVAFPK